MKRAERWRRSAVGLVMVASVVAATCHPAIAADRATPSTAPAMAASAPADRLAADGLTDAAQRTRAAVDRVLADTGAVR